MKVVLLTLDIICAIFFGINTVDFCSDDKCVVLFLDKQSKEFFQGFKKRLKRKRARNKLKSK